MLDPDQFGLAAHDLAVAWSELLELRVRVNAKERSASAYGLITPRPTAPAVEAGEHAFDRGPA
jgi:hypothetical protein